MGDVKKDPIQNNVDETSVIEERNGSEHRQSDSNMHEDVPADFFDDFMRKEFVDGFEIIDEAVVQPENVVETNNKESIEKINDRGEKPTEKRDKPVEKRDEAIKKPKEINEDKSNKKKPRSKDTESKKRRSPVRNKATDYRRDPEKTRHAIQRDKLFSAKEKEKQLVTDIIQTGLVPPGMELEVDLYKIQEIDKQKNKSLPVKKPSKEKSSDRSSTSYKDARKDPAAVSYIRIRRSRSPIRRAASPIRRFPSPVRRGASLIRRNPSPIRRGLSPNRRSPSPKRRRYSPIPRRSPYMYKRRVIVSPLYRRKSRSPSPKRSRDRESRRSFSKRNRSRSRSVHRKEKRKEEKMSFLEELAVKLNTPSAYGNHAIVEPKHKSRSPNQLQKKEEESLLLKELAVKLNSSVPSLPSHPVSMPQLPVVRMNTIGLHSMSIIKFFEDNSMKLSDLLTISAKSQVNVPAPEEQERSRVMRRCQAAIRMLSERPAAELSVHKSEEYRRLADEKTSPLVRRLGVRFPFTTPTEKNEQDARFAVLCRNLLRRVDAEVEAETAAGTPAVPVSDYDDAFLDRPRMSTCEAGAQTDLSLMTCGECKRRGKILLADSTTQTSYPGHFSVGTNVTEADFYATIPKTQSLASLTPAQLLGKLAVLGEIGASRVPEREGIGRNRMHDAPSRYENPRRFSPQPPSAASARPPGQSRISPNAPMYDTQEWSTLYNAVNRISQFKKY
ncbi:hypothetical protein GWI33_017517 [Rhynchophorus ferrugineus]|uniref:Uncharacterized protein n=1 Tax=Rhynchophorus ferrugineus TaxID=354439 RepID=A0A834HZN1_RHYFE|nr:hypothetical protein GWI33_017517 [Rhynchophorus ferrugineus]